MSKGLIVALCILAVLAMFSMILFGSIVGFRNSVVTFQKTIAAQRTDMSAKYNEYFNKVKEAAQVPTAQLDQLKKVYAELIEGRKTAGESLRAIAESNPQINQDTFVEIQRIISAGRSEIYNIQRVHIDTVREYNTVITLFPNNLMNVLFNFKEETPTVPIAGEVDTIFKTGVDKPIAIFQ